MAMVAMTDKEIELTVSNVVKACKDITKLNKRGYKFIYLACGFIAHYNLTGFIDYYENYCYCLKQDILDHQRMNQYNNFNVSDNDYDYHMAYKKCYNLICDKLDNQL